MKILKNCKIINDGNGNIFKNKDILIENGIIKRIDENIDDIKAMDIIDCKDYHILPGFIDSLNIWGCEGPGWRDTDTSELSDPLTPELNIIYSFDPDNMHFQRVFEYGVTSVGLSPSTGNILGGQSSVVKTFGNHVYKMLVKEKINIIGSVSNKTKEYGKRNIKPMTKMGSFSLLEENLYKTKDYSVNKENYNEKYESLLNIINGEKPLFLNCNTTGEMDSVERLLNKFPDINLVFTGGYGINKNTGSIFNRNWKLILGDLTNGMNPYNSELDFEAIEYHLNNGIDIAISSGGDYTASGKESLLWNGILYYKNGIDSNTVIKMLTSIPARILNVDNKIGSIEEGKDADIVIWTDNPIESFKSKIVSTIVNGEDILNVRRGNTCWS